MSIHPHKVDKSSASEWEPSSNGVAPKAFAFFSRSTRRSDRQVAAVSVYTTFAFRICALLLFLGFEIMPAYATSVVIFSRPHYQRLKRSSEEDHCR